MVQKNNVFLCIVVCWFSRSTIIKHGSMVNNILKDQIGLTSIP